MKYVFMYFQVGQFTELKNDTGRLTELYWYLWEVNRFLYF